MKLLFFIPSLQCGGAERVAVTLCNSFAERGWDVTLATFDDGAIPPFFPLAPPVRHVTLGLQRRSTGFWHSIVNNVRRVPRLRRFIAGERPDRIVSFIDAMNVLSLVAAWGTGIPVVVSERTVPERHPVPVAWRFLRRLTYPRAHAIVLQTRAAASHFPASWASRIAVLPNPVPRCAGRSESGEALPDGKGLLLALGRLESPKGFDLLIRAFARIANANPLWNLKILGEGPDRESLERQIASAGLANRVSLPGAVSDPAAALRQGDLFVLSSRYEGFPNALCEAMACGLPVVAFDCPTGPAEIVRDGVDGLLVPPEDVEALAAAIAGLIADPARRKMLARSAANVSDRFSVERVAAQWERVLVQGSGAAVEAAGEGG